MLDCQAVIDRLFDYIDGELTEENKLALKNHLDLCKQCFDRIQFEFILREKMKNKTHVCCPEKLRRRIQILIEQF
jgi:anti-sigma factor (TIGR02949 family)